MEKRKNYLLPIILISVLFGLIAGITGEIITRVYFFQDLSVPYFNDEFNLADLNYNRSNLIIRDAKKVVVNQDIKIEETINSIKPALLRIFKKIPVDEESVEESTILSQVDLNAKGEEDKLYYRLDEPDFIALIVTSDGWAAASLPEKLEKDFNIEDYVAIDNNRQIYELDELSDFKNLSGNLIFFHLQNASSLSIKAIASRSDISLGQSVLVIRDFNNAWLTSLSSLKSLTSISSSDDLNVRINLAGSLNEDLVNSFIFNLSGDLVAIVGAEKEIVPAFSYIYHWQSFFADKSFSRPFLGVNYLDLSRIKMLGLKKEKGALLQEELGSPAVVFGSPAELAGLAAGDIITWVNNKELNYDNDLSSIISTYRPGDEISIIYLRDNEEFVVKVKLGSKDKDK
jgi:hypothetical protein